MSRERQDVRKDDRKDEERSLENRLVETREQYAARKMHMKPSDKLYVDPAKMPRGWTYKWVRVSVKNEPDDNNANQARRNEWTPVPAERHPELVTPDFLGTGKSNSKVIINSGLLLCEKPSHHVKVDDDLASQQTNRITNSLVGLNNNLNDDLMHFDPSHSRQSTTYNYRAKYVNAAPTGNSDFQN